MRGLAEHAKGKELWQQGKRTLALKKHAKACQLNPRHPVFARHYAFTLMQVHEPGKGRRQMQRALELAWPDTNTTMETCVAARDVKLYDLLFDFLDGKELEPPLLYFYADALDRRGENLRALELVSNIPENIRQQFAFLQLLYGQLLSRNKQPDEALMAVRKLSVEKLPPPLQPELYYTKAAIHDRLGDVEAAFVELENAKELLGKGATADASLAEYSRKLNRGVLQTLPPKRSPQQANEVVLCGHPRSGTTLIEQVLDSHPKVLSVEEQDCFFSSVMTPLSGQSATPEEVVQAMESTPKHRLKMFRASYQKQLRSYLAKESLKDAQLVIDKFPDLSTVLGVYRKVLPEAKFIIALRDPRDVVLSCYFQNLPMNDASRAYLKLETAAQKYISTLRCWLDSKAHFSDGWIETRYEDWVANSERESRRVLEFLELEWSPEVLNFHQRKKVVSSPTYADVAQPIYSQSVGRWRKYENQLAPILEQLNPICQALGYPEA